MLDQLDKYDKQLSDYFHHLDSRIVTILLHPFAMMFNPSFIIVPISIVYFLSRSKIMTFFYVLCIGLNLFMSLISKKALNRDRPTFYVHLKYKTSTFRSKEKHRSLPSGDSIQAINFALTLFFIAENYNSWFSYNSLHYLIPSMIVFVILVMLGRIYFMCHYVMDTVLGVIMGYGLTRFLQTHVYPPFFSQFATVDAQ